VIGRLTGAAGSIPYRLALQALSTTTLRFTISADPPDACEVGRRR
jgi:hypothetical protein